MAMEQSHVRLKERAVSLFVRSREGRKGDKPPLILLHGWPASSRGWEPVVAALPDDRTVICPDLRGLGQSERTGTFKQFAKQALAHDILDLTAVLGIDEFVIGGQDWGGAVAQEVALAEPDRAKALIIMNINLINNFKGNLEGFKVQAMSPRNPRWYMSFQSEPKLAEAMIPGSEDLWVRYFFKQGSAEDAVIDDAILAGYVEDYARHGTARCGAVLITTAPWRWMPPAGRV